MIRHQQYRIFLDLRGINQIYRLYLRLRMEISGIKLVTGLNSYEVTAGTLFISKQVLMCPSGRLLMVYGSGISIEPKPILP